MDFLRNVGKAFKQTANDLAFKAASKLNQWFPKSSGIKTTGNGFANAYSSLGAKTASANDSFDISKYSFGDNSVSQSAINQATQGGSAPSGSQFGPALDLSKLDVAEIRPSTWSAPVDQYGRTSSKTEGQPYVNEQGFTVTPTRGFTGLEGMGGSGFTANSTPATTGMSGVSGTGARGFAGAGQGTTAIAYGQPNSDEEKRKQEEQQRGTVTVNAPTNNPTLNAVNTFAAQGQNQPVTAPDVPQVIDAGWLSQIGESINNTVSSGLSAVDKQAVYAQLTQNLLAAKQRLDQQQPIPENPVVDTPEQMEFINQSADPFGAKQLIDELKGQQTNLGAKEATLADLNKTVTALTDAYKPILKEIRENPNLPKSLARRKIEALAFTQKETLDGLLTQKAQLQEEIKNENEKINRQMGIITMAQNFDNQNRDNARADLQLYASQGALGGIPDEQLQSYAQRFNVSVPMLKKMRDEALNPKVDIITNEFADGSLRGIDKKTGKTVWSVPGAGGSGAPAGTRDITETINGRRVVMRLDQNNKVISQTDLGPSGENSATELKSKFMQYLQTVAGSKKKSDLEKEARLAGLSPEDKDISAAINDTKIGFFSGLFK